MTGSVRSASADSVPAERDMTERVPAGGLSPEEALLGRERRRVIAAALVSAVFATLFAAALPQAQAADSIILSETGSTLLYPLFQLWIPDYTRLAANVSLTTAATGSGAGIDAAISGAARIGASDAYMSDEQVQKNRGILNIPVAIAAQTINYNVPGLNETGLKLDGPTLAGIYSGRITV